MSQDSREDSPREDGGFGQLRGVMSEAAVSVLTPVAKTFATNAAKLAVKRGPELLEDTILPKLQDLGAGPRPPQARRPPAGPSAVVRPTSAPPPATAPAGAGACRSSRRSTWPRR